MGAESVLRLFTEFVISPQRNQVLRCPMNHHISRQSEPSAPAVIHRVGTPRYSVSFIILWVLDNPSGQWWSIYLFFIWVMGIRRVWLEYILQLLEFLGYFWINDYVGPCDNYPPGIVPYTQSWHSCIPRFMHKFQHAILLFGGRQLCHWLQWNQVIWLPAIMLIGLHSIVLFCCMQRCYWLQWN